MSYSKRLIDILLAVIGLAFIWPILFVCAVAVKLSSPGPVLYLGKRTGRYGVPFKIFKFRSMREDAERTGGTTTGKNDTRITSAGKFLRKYKLDELPQLFNVLRGEMSFVGPRPEVAEYTEMYSVEEQEILSVRPGITDLSSLTFSDLQSHVGSEDPDEAFRRYVLPQKNRLRLKYAREHTILMDFIILMKTVLLVVAKPLKSLTQNGIHKSS